MSRGGGPLPCMSHVPKRYPQSAKALGTIGRNMEAGEFAVSKS